MFDDDFDLSGELKKARVCPVTILVRQERHCCFEAIAISVVLVIVSDVTVPIIGMSAFSSSALCVGISDFLFIEGFARLHQSKQCPRRQKSHETRAEGVVASCESILSRPGSNNCHYACLQASCQVGYAFHSDLNRSSTVCTPRAELPSPASSPRLKL